MHTIQAPPPVTPPNPTDNHRDAYWAGRLSVALEGLLEALADDTYPDLLVPGRLRLSAEALVEMWDDYPGLTPSNVQSLIRRVAAGEQQVTR